MKINEINIEITFIYRNTATIMKTHETISVDIQI
jgi:hypothetical protein